MKVSPSVKTALSLGLLLGVLGVGAVGLAQYLRQRQEAAPENVPSSSVTPPAALPSSGVMPPQSFAMGEPVPGGNLASVSGFLLAGSAAQTGMPDMQAALDRMRDPALAPSDRYAVGPWAELIADKHIWGGHPVQDDRMYAGGSPGFYERQNGREFLA